MCGNRKVEVNCETIRSKNLANVECDSVCEEKQKLAEQMAKEKFEEQQRLDAERKKKEIEEFEKKFTKPRKYKERKIETEEEVDYTKYYVIATVVAVGLLSAIILYFVNK